MEVGTGYKLTIRSVCPSAILSIELQPELHDDDVKTSGTYVVVYDDTYNVCIATFFMHSNSFLLSEKIPAPKFLVHKLCTLKKVIIMIIIKIMCTQGTHGDKLFKKLYCIIIS